MYIIGLALLKEVIDLTNKWWYYKNMDKFDLDKNIDEVRRIRGLIMDLIKPDILKDPTVPLVALISSLASVVAVYGYHMHKIIGHLMLIYQQKMEDINDLLAKDSLLDPLTEKKKEPTDAN